MFASLSIMGQLWGPGIPIYEGIIALFVVLNFSLATFMDPGAIPKGESEKIALVLYFKNC